MGEGCVLLRYLLSFIKILLDVKGEALYWGLPLFEKSGCFFRNCSSRNGVRIFDATSMSSGFFRNCSNRNGVRIFEHILLMTRQKSAGGLSPVKDF